MLRDNVIPTKQFMVSEGFALHIHSGLLTERLQILVHPKLLALVSVEPIPMKVSAPKANAVWVFSTRDTT